MHLQVGDYFQRPESPIPTKIVAVCTMLVNARSQDFPSSFFLYRKWRVGHLSQTLKKKHQGRLVWGHHLLPHHPEETAFLCHQHHRALHPHERASYFCLLPASWSRSVCFDVFWLHLPGYVTQTVCVACWLVQFSECSLIPAVVTRSVNCPQERRWLSPFLSSSLWLSSCFCWLTRSLRPPWAFQSSSITSCSPWSWLLSPSSWALSSSTCTTERPARTSCQTGFERWGSRAGPTSRRHPSASEEHFLNPHFCRCSFTSCPSTLAWPGQSWKSKRSQVKRSR